jgi:ABC-type molybdate transport system substrate-binding protein
VTEALRISLAKFDKHQSQVVVSSLPSGAVAKMIKSGIPGSSFFLAVNATRFLHG